MNWCRRALSGSLSACLVMTASPALAAPPASSAVGQASTPAEPADVPVDTNAAIFDLGLGVSLTALAVGLGARGGGELANARALERRCETDTNALVCFEVANPVRSAKFAAGLAFALAVPILTGGIWLTVRGSRSLKKARAQGRARASVAPAMLSHGAGLALSGRF